ncbi:MAG: hypothetical protein J6J15_02525 [Oscillospiraceae bacterium]|nr:hypothetical protein [Oscillospiraceae bacterium]
MPEKMRYVELSETDNNITIHALNEFRNKLISEKKSTDDINYILNKFICAPEKKPRWFSREER